MEWLKLLGRDPVARAVRALQVELEDGPRAELSNDVEQLVSLVLEREARTRAALKEEPERELLAAFPEAAALIGKDGRIRLANAAFDELSSSGRAAGMTPLELTRSAELAEAVKRALQGTARRLEIALPRRNLVARLVPLLRGEVLLVMRDVTEARRAEAARRDFVANASHELRTPVSAVAAAAETLLDGALDDPAQARHFVEVIARHAERLARLTRDLLDLSRIESREWPIALAPVKLAPLAQGVLDLFASSAEEKRLVLAREVPSELSALADARALEQVLVNLVDNAVKYTPAGGKITVGAAEDGPAVVLSVADTGPGIERHHLPRLFERFYRVDPGRSREAGGTGLGLAIVKHLVQAQGGEVGVDSGAGGSRFWVRVSRA